MKNKVACENRPKNQIEYIVFKYFTYDMVALICGVVLFVSLFVVIFVPGELWFKIALPSLLAIPVIIRIILTVCLNSKLYKNPSKTITINNPVAKVIRTWQGGDVYYLKGLSIKGEYNGKTIHLFEYPLKESSTLYFKKEKEINGKSSIEITIVEGTHVVNNFYEEKQRSKTKQTAASYTNQSTGKAKKFKYAPIDISKEDLIVFLSYFSMYEELYLLNQSNKYAILKISVSGKIEKRYITIDDLTIDDVDKTLAWLESNGYIVDGRAKLLSIMDLNDPKGFSQELESIRNGL